MFKRCLSEAVFHFVAVKDLAFDDRLEWEAVFNVAHLVKDLLHLFRRSKELCPLARPLVSKADQIATVTLRGGNVFLVVMNLDLFVL